MSDDPDPPRGGPSSDGYPDASSDAIGPTALAQAVGSRLEPGEGILCARFVLLTRGRLIGTPSQHAANVLIVTDHRVMRATAYIKTAWGPVEKESDPAVGLWRADVPISTGYLSRRSVWLRQIRDVGCRWHPRPGLQYLVLLTTDDRRQVVTGRSGTIGTLERAIRDGLGRVGRWSIPAPAPDP